MNRDCGKGKLIPIRYTLTYCIGKSDDETNKETSAHQTAWECGWKPHKQDPKTISWEQFVETSKKAGNG